jgi:Cys-rich four helix bundle protein (predicted Tat secretion target)
MNRRELLAGVGTVVAGSAFLSGPIALAATPENLGAILAACVEKGEACIGMCMSEMAKGNKDMAKCNQKVHEMVAICKAMQSLVSYKATDRLKDMAKVCMTACKECADSCAEHKAHWATHHAECKDCHDECMKTIDAIKKAYA